MSRAQRPAQRSKRDRFNSKIHDRIAIARCEAAIRKEEQATREVVLDTLSDLAYA